MASEGAEVAVALRTVSMWLSLPLLQRMEAFLSLLSLHQQQLAAAAAAVAADTGYVPCWPVFSRCAHVRVPEQ